MAKYAETAMLEAAMEKDYVTLNRLAADMNESERRYLLEAMDVVERAVENRGTS